MAAVLLALLAAYAVPTRAAASDADDVVSITIKNNRTSPSDCLIDVSVRNLDPNTTNAYQFSVPSSSNVIPVTNSRGAGSYLFGGNAKIYWVGKQLADISFARYPSGLWNPGKVTVRNTCSY